ncbi:MAG: hypothetical protein HN742_23900 [Lentisphaerae bacterium]|jgi:hypothetical protein|nr:hypothetical protein [Lentisphaerota bacterium]MBT5612786.1 hypothetical protein [Lentisphaerota bacterium]MBT7057612.1 hypothetical protein [Lentisphaerota bacterium]MBT7844941.1 hypothetical protein [Lentisphaerota bacterium]
MKTFCNALFWLALAVAGLVCISFGYHQLLKPREALLPNPDAGEPDYDAIADRITGTTLQEDIKQYTQFGSRFAGSEGFEKTADHVISRFEELGYEVIVQPHEVVVPKTVFCEVLGEDGKPIPGVVAHPYYPNRLRTATTPPEGITGRVVYKGDPDGDDKIGALDQAGGNIMLLRVRERFQDFANFGARAVIYFNEHTDDVSAGHFRRKESHTSVNVPVVFVKWAEDAAEGEDEEERATKLKELLEGSTVTVRCRVDWTRTKVRNILAILPQSELSKQSDETLLLSAYYDAWSSIPDMAPGARQVLGLQALMIAAENLVKPDVREAMRRKVVLFVAGGRGQAASGSRYLMSALGTEPEPEKVIERYDEEKEEFSTELGLLKELLDVAPRYFEEARSRTLSEADAEGSKRKRVLKGLHKAFWEDRTDLLTLFRQELELVCDERAAEAEDEALEERLDWLRSGSGKGAELDDYLKANKKAQVYQSLTNAKPYILVDGAGYVNYFDPNAELPPQASGMPTVVRPDMDEEAFEEYLKGRFDRLMERLRHRIARNTFYLEQIELDMRVFREIRGETGERRVAGLEINFADKTNQLVLASGGWWWSSRCIPADREFALQFKAAQEKLNPLEKEKVVSRVPKGDVQGCGTYYFINYFHTAKMVFNGFTSFVLINKGDNREVYASPMDTVDDIKWDNVVDLERIIVAGIEQVGRGGAKFIPISMPVWGRDFDGLTTSIRGNSLVPNHPEQNSVVQMIGTFWSAKSWRGYENGGGYWTGHMDPYPLTMSDELGRFRFRNCFAHRWWMVSFHAARSNPESGEINWIRDLGYEKKYPTERRRVHQVSELTRIVLFRCTPVHIFKAENPQKMKLYDRVEARLVRGFSRPKRYYAEQFYAGEYVLYLEPDAIFYPTYLSGAPENQSLLRISGVSLNVTPKEFESEIAVEQDELEGKGHLAADVTFMYHPGDDLARSMSAINTRRVLRYSKYELLDEPTIESANKARDLSIGAADLRKEGRHYEAFQMMKDSLAYSTSIHPVIKNSKNEAVYGIIFYLLLLIPFAFFAEKLMVGSSDIRRQIMWVGIIFLAVFFALRAIHPAFEIVRSSFMILLGFITLMLSILVTFFVSTKFRAAVTEYQKIIHGQQATADVSKASAAFTGFLLGINNMRKRKVRTALTASTLVLITFVMICFTAVENDYVEVEYPIGRAPYTGIEIRRNTLGHLGTQTTVLVNAFVNDYDVAVRRWDVGGLWGIMPMNKRLEAETYISPEEIDNLSVTVVREVDGKSLKWAAKGSMPIGPAPDFEVADFLVVGDTWFENEHESKCVLGLGAARELGITPDMLKGEGPKPTVKVQGRDLEVINLFDEAKLDAFRNTKEEPITPINYLAERAIEEKEKAEKAAREKAKKEAEEKGETVAEKPADEGTVASEEAAPPAREKIRLPASGLVIFPKQRQPKPEVIFSHFKGKLRVNQCEPVVFDSMFITKVKPHEEDEKHAHYWFRDDDPSTCFIPARMAAEMKISPRMVETSEVRIRVQGTVLIVKGIYDGQKFDQVHDLDGESLAPYDVESIIGRPSEDSVEEDEMPEMMKRLSGSDIIICNDRSITHGWHVASIAIDLSEIGSHKGVRKMLDRYLEKTESKAFYGIGDTAYFGAKFRRPRGSNYLELLIPLLIASLTVLNTMRGSVYERRDEIYVYNAVGLNPFHVFFLFIAEACVYAVVGALGGYLIANFAGTLVKVLGLSAGLTINYSSIYAVMYSVVIMAAVILSTWFPARAAARLAAPAEDMKWRVPEPEDGVISFTLPFTFNRRDSIGIVAYFMGWLDEFGEGSSGKFYASPPECALERYGEQPAAALRVVTWLRPYDLGVSQEVTIYLTEDPEHGQSVARMRLAHLSGGISAWQRTNYLFLRILRKHFLDWRMVPDEEKRAYLERARAMLAPSDDDGESTAA